MKEIDLERKIKIKDNYFQLIIDLGFDYDGFNDSEKLKLLIDELVRYANLGLSSNDTESMTIDENRREFNILGEELENGIHK